MSDKSGSKSTVLYTPSLEEVIESEKGYLEERRKLNGLPRPNANNVWGLAISGGGIRSATFALGAMQALIQNPPPNGVLRRFDYMSTVSGGGYIGSCLTSLLTGKPKRAIDPVVGLEPETSPFVALNREDHYEEPDKTRLGVRHQIHHLRTHGEYLAPKGKGLLTRDVQRALGAVLSGIIHHFVLFLLLLVALASATHFLLSPLDARLVDSGVVDAQGAPVMELQRVFLKKQEGLDISFRPTLAYLQDLSLAWFKRLPPLFEAFSPKDWNWKRWTALLSAFLIGIAFAGGWIARVLHLSKGFNAQAPPSDETLAGFNREDDLERRFARALNLSSIGMAVALMWTAALNTKGSPYYCFFLPLAFAAGKQLTAHTLMQWIESRKPGNLARRSLFLTVQGAAVYGLFLAAAAPFAVVVLLALSGMPWVKFFGAGLAFLVSRKLISPAKTQGEYEKPPLIVKLKKPLLNAMVVIAVALGFSAVSDWLLNPDFTLYAESAVGKFWVGPLVVFGLAAGLLSAFGVVVDSNRISPHYFYRDRLSEAYLRTTARVKRKGGNRQGMPLHVIRNDEELKLSDLGDGNGRGPYHLLVTALNLRGSAELSRKTMLSDHFIFSKNYVGSNVTGYVRTKAYRDNETKLARAMTISAAAAGSGAGFHTSALSAFMLTLFNVRLGYWMENPWYYRPGVGVPATAPWTYWPRFLLRELLGKPTARLRLVNLSDGGHTGDNLGLLPLLQRRCKLIVVLDGEADGDYEFSSFNNAVRMAFIEENIEIEIDLSAIRPAPITRKELADGELRLSEKSWEEGSIEYPDGSRGVLIYLKSSLGAREDRKLPVHVSNYARTNPDFPHQTTADQFFDDAQFESYRALGHHVGEEAAAAIAAHMAGERTRSTPGKAAKKKAKKTTRKGGSRG